MLPKHTHPEEYFTQIDALIDFEATERTLIEDYPSQFVSVQWQGYLLADHSESYTIHIAAFADAYFTLRLDGKLVLNNEFG